MVSQMRCVASGSDEKVLWQVHSLAGHAAGVQDVAFSPDGKRVVSGSKDKLVKIWNAATGTEVCSFVECIEGGGVMVVFCRLSLHLVSRNWSEERVGWQVCTLRRVHSESTHLLSFSLT